MSETIVHAIGNNYIEFSARHCRPFYTGSILILLLILHYILKGLRTKVYPILRALSDEELDGMKFILEDYLPKVNEVSRVKTPIDLFRLMMKLGIISERKLDPLERMLEKVGRKDLASEVQKIKGKQ